MNLAAQFGTSTVGVDLGATLTRVVAVDSALNVGPVASAPTAILGAGSPTERIGELIALVERVLPDRSGLRSIGIGASGPIDSGGVIRNPGTLPAFSDLPLVDRLAEHFGVPCHIDNDAVTAAIAEHRCGAGMEASCMVMVTLGTGIGVAVLRDGVPVRGGDGEHPEAGHIPVPGPPDPCYCGLEHCWEQIASRRALERLATWVMDDHEQSDDPRNAVAALAARAADSDPAACEALRTYGRAVGHGLATLIAVYRPSRVVLGGSASEHFGHFFTGLRDTIRRSTEFTVETDIVTAVLGDAGGAIGAALLATEPTTNTTGPEQSGAIKGAR